MQSRSRTIVPTAVAIIIASSLAAANAPASDHGSSQSDAKDGNIRAPDGAEEMRVTVDLPAQSLSASLHAIADKLNTNVLFDPERVRNRQAPPIKGTITIEQALNALLVGTELRYQYMDERTISVVPRDPRATSREPEQGKLRLAQADADVEGSPGDSLAEITVTGERERGYSSRTQSSAMFGEQSILDTPFQVSVFPIELLQDQQVRTLFHVSKNDASTGTAVNSGGTGYYDSVSVRGFPILNASGYYREGLVFANNAQMPFENKAAVEVVKGLSALRYGFTAPGGIVNYVLKRPTEQPYRFIDVFGDSNGGYGAHIDLGGKISEDIGIRVNSVVAHEDQFIDGVGGERQMISMFLTWQPSDRWLIEADAEYQNRDTTLGQNLRISNFNSSMSQDEIRNFLDRFDRRTFIGEEWTEYPTRTFIGSVHAAYEFAPDWKVRMKAQKAEIWRNQTNFFIANGSLMPNGDYDVNLWRSPDQEFSPFSLEATVTGNFATGSIGHDLVIGAMTIDHPYYYPNTSLVPIGGKNVFDPTIHLENPSPAVGDSVLKERLNQLAFFATDYVRITDRLNLFAGVRYSRPKFETFFGPNDSRDLLYEETAVTPSAGVVFKPRQNVSLYASYAEGIEQGGTAPVGTVNAMETLPPLMSRQHEIGAKADLHNGATLSAAIFEIDKALELIDGSNRYVQDGRQVHRGVEASLAGQVTSALRLVASAQYLDASMEKTAGGALDGKQPFNVPQLKVSGYASWRLPAAPAVSVNLGIFYSDERFVDTANTFVIDDYVRFDAGLRYGFKFGAADATLRLAVENLTDENYFSGTSFGYLLYGEPRTLRMSLSASY